MNLHVLADKQTEKNGVDVHFDFNVGDAVTVRGSSIEASVTGLCKDTHGTQYRICYWYNGCRADLWVFPFEIIAKASS